MNLKSKLLYISILLFCFATKLSNGFTADTASTGRIYYPHSIAWFETDINKKLNDKWAIQFDFQYRRQNRPTEKNPFEFPLLTGLRPFIHYSFNKDIRLSFSPAGYFFNTNYLIKGSTLQEFNPEIRSTLQLQINTKPGSRLFVQHRYRYELRLRQYYFPNRMLDDRYLPVHRIRYLLRATVPLKGSVIEPKSYYLTLFDELMLGFGKNLGTLNANGNVIPGNNIFDQNRIYLALGYKQSSNLRIEFGPFNQLAMRPSNAANPKFSTAAANGHAPVLSQFDLAFGAQLFVFFDDLVLSKQGEKAP